MAVLSALLAWLGNLLGGPFAKAAVEAYSKKLDSENSAQKIAADLATQELALQAKEEELQIQYRIATVGRWYEPDKLMGYCVAIYFAKLLIFDKVLGMGRTDPLTDWSQTTANLIVAFYFGKRTFENVARIIKR